MQPECMAAPGDRQGSSCPHMVGRPTQHRLASDEGATPQSEQRRPAPKVMASDGFRLKNHKAMEPQKHKISAFSQPVRISLPRWQVRGCLLPNSIWVYGMYHNKK